MTQRDHANNRKILARQLGCRESARVFGWLVFFVFQASLGWAGQTSLSMSSDPGDYIGGGQQYYYTPSDGSFGAIRNFASGVSISFNTPNFSHFWYLDYAAPHSQPLTPGSYTGATRFPFQDPSQPGLAVYGDGRGCNTLTGSFEVRETVYGLGDEIVSFRATFEQHCEGALPALRGEIRFNANVPVELTSPRNLSVFEGQELRFDLTAVALDGGHVTLTASGLPAGATFTDRGDNTGQFVWTPSQSQIGVHTVTFSGQDSLGNTETVSTVIAVGGTIRVPADQPSIQAAIDAAAPGSFVLVSPGTYVENIDFRGKAITVESEGGPDVTVIDGSQADSVVAFVSGEGQASVLRGFTVQNGRSGFDTPGFGDGGGIRIQGASPTISWNRIVNNSACDGAGISIGFGSPILRENVISNNTRAGCSGGTGGGGIRIGGSSTAQIIDNIISNNATGAGGGGISLFASVNSIIRGNVITANSGPVGGISMLNDVSGVAVIQNLIVGNTFGGGINWSNPPALLVNNTIADNQGPGVFAGAFSPNTQLVNNIVVGNGGQNAIFCERSGITNPANFRSNNVFGPSGGAYGGMCTDQTGTNGNISGDPLFVNAATGDYHLQAGSPSINAGDSTAPDLPTTDLDGDPRVLGATVDMGADEFNPTFPNRAPVAEDQSVRTPEDAPTSIILLVSDADLDSVTFSIVTDPTNGTLSAVSVAPCAGGPGCWNGFRSSVSYTPSSNVSGADSFTYKANDGQIDGNIALVSLTVTPVNDPPSFIKGPDQAVPEEAGDQSVVGWATGISAGPPDEGGQTLTFLVSNNNAALFATQPALAANGTLTYTPAPNANGTATVTVRLQDNGGTANGGVDTSSPQTFTITVTPVNAHTLTITDGPRGSSNPVASGGTASLTVTAVDSLGHALTYAWSASCPTLGGNGTFSNPALQNLTWTAPPNTTGSQQSCTISVTVSDGLGLGSMASYAQAVAPATVSTLTLHLNQATFGPSDTMIVMVTLTPGPVPVLVDAYVVVQLPDRSFLSLQLGGGVVPGIVPIARGISPFPFTGEILRYTFTGSEPFGNYTWFGGLTQPGTLNLVSPLEEEPFTVTP